MAPLIQEILEKARTEGDLVFEDTQDATGLYLSLLIGDLQIRRAIGREPEPDEDYIATRSERALKYFTQLLAD